MPSTWHGGFCCGSRRVSGTGSTLCPTSGSNWGVDYFADMARQIAKEDGVQFTMAKIYAEVDQDVVIEHVRNDTVTPLRPVLPYGEEEVRRSRRIVGVLGAEPFQEALRQGADVILAGRSTDTAIFAAIPLMRGIDPAVAWHAGKVAECGSSAAEPRLRLDVLRVEVDAGAFYTEALRDEVRCTPFSVGGVQLHEVSNPFTMVEPGVVVDSPTSSKRPSTTRGCASAVPGRRRCRTP